MSVEMTISADRDMTPEERKEWHKDWSNMPEGKPKAEAFYNEPKASDVITFQLSHTGVVWMITPAHTWLIKPDELIAIGAAIEKDKA